MSQAKLAQSICGPRSSSIRDSGIRNRVAHGRDRAEGVVGAEILRRLFSGPDVIDSYDNHRLEKRRKKERQNVSFCGCQYI